MPTTALASCRDEVALIEQRTALVNQLQQALYEYYPAALEAFGDWCAPSAWAFVERFPTPQSLVQAGKRKWQNFLHAHNLFHPEWNQKRMEIFAKADQFCGVEATIAAKSALAVATVKMLQTLEAQLAGSPLPLITDYFQQHPDHALFASLPGAGPKLAPRLLGELAALKPLAETPQALQCLAWRARRSRSTSGRAKCLPFYLHYHCAIAFANATIHLWVDLSRHYCDWAPVHKRIARKARATPAPCAAWECAGSKSCAAVMHTRRPMTRRFTRATSFNTAPGCCSCNLLR